MRNWIDLFESVDPRSRDVSQYVLTADETERTETVADILQTAKLDGFGGHCFAAAYAINVAIFGGKGDLVASYNGPLMTKDASFFGHVAVRFGDTYWDADGTPKGLEEVESWGMLDADDPDYDVTPEEAESVTTKVFEPETVLNMAKMRGDDPTEWENAIYRAVSAIFEF